MTLHTVLSLGCMFMSGGNAACVLTDWHESRSIPLFNAAMALLCATIAVWLVR